MVQLLVAARSRPELVVFADHDLTTRRLVERVHPEGPDVEIPADEHASAAGILGGPETEAPLGCGRRSLLERDQGVRRRIRGHGCLLELNEYSLNSNYFRGTLTGRSFDVKTFTVETSSVARPRERDHVDRFLEEIRDELPKAMDLVVEGIVDRIHGINWRLRKMLDETLAGRYSDVRRLSSGR